MSYLLITFGIVLVAIGLAWPLLTQLGWGRLPGISASNARASPSTFFMSSLIVSAVVSLILWLLRK